MINAVYCPSCDKSYGAAHSRCPECHSWLKMSAPAKSGSSHASGSFASSEDSGGVSTLERESETGWSASNEAWDSTEDGWGGSADGWETPASSPPPKKESEKAPSGGWLGEGGWDDTAPQAGRGWLGDGPTMTEMVDKAINVEDDDVFVHDSWVDEEILDDDFQDLAVPQYEPPSQEVGSAFLKMLLVAALIVIMGAGVLVIDRDSKTPEQQAADERAQKLQSVQAYEADGQSEMQSGRPELAASQFGAALTVLSELKADEKKIDQMELQLATALMKSEEYGEATDHWNNLIDSNAPEVAEAAAKGLAEAKRAKRLEANGLLSEAHSRLDQGEHLGARALAKESIEIYKNFEGSRSQLGEAYGTLGLSFLEVGDYGSAESYLRKSVEYAPELGYRRHLNSIAVSVQPNVVSRPLPQLQEDDKPVFDPGGPDYEVSNHRPTARPGRPSSTAQTEQTAVVAQPQRKPMEEIKAWQTRPKPQNGRLGEDGELQTYRTR